MHYCVLLPRLLPLVLLGVYRFDSLDCRQLLIGYIAPLTGKAGYRRTTAASTMAVEKAKSEGLLPDTDVR